MGDSRAKDPLGPWLLSAVYFDDDGRNTALNLRRCPARLASSYKYVLLLQSLIDRRQIDFLRSLTLHA
jgi:hypothetical protein